MSLFFFGSSFTGIVHRSSKRPNKEPFVTIFAAGLLAQFLAFSRPSATRAAPRKKATQHRPRPYPGRAPPLARPGGRRVAGRLVGRRVKSGRWQSSERVARQVKPAARRRCPPGGKVARRSGLTLRRRRWRAAGTPPGRRARWRLGRPSPCAALRGLQLGGGASLLGWERREVRAGRPPSQGRSGAGRTSGARPVRVSVGPARLPVRFHLQVRLCARGRRGRGL